MSIGNGGNPPKTGSGGVKSVSTDYAHHEIHGGNHYVASKSATLGVDATAEFLLKAPAGPAKVHLINFHRSQGEARMEIFKDTVVTADGAAVAINNRNQSSSKTPGLQIFDGPTITDDGTALPGFDQHFGSGQASGGETRALNEMVLNPGTSYLVRITSEAAGNEINCIFDFYESDDDF
jgi:hypothetical protein